MRACLNVVDLNLMDTQGELYSETTTSCVRLTLDTQDESTYTPGPEKGVLITVDGKNLEARALVRRLILEARW